jgi:D-beta-D-heptose 7-phosphate kinase/D-beta-D-heptose 1-phosphate adenosyltransferase
MPILVVGDIMLDRFTYGKVMRISPESPVPVLSVERENVMLGGAGNTLSNLIHLGCKGRIVSIIGADENGELLKRVAEKNGIDPSGLIKTSDRPTIVKTRFLAGHQQLLRTDYERISPVQEQYLQELINKSREAMEGIGAVIISDYGKGLLIPAFVKELIAMARAKGIPVLVDPKGKDFSIYAGADVVTPNKKELGEATGGMVLDTDKQVEEAASYLINNSGVNCVVATRSKDGMSIIRRLGQNEIGAKAFEFTHIRSAEDIEVFDVSGAGDTVIATIAAALGAGANIVEAASLANIAGSIVVAKVGTAPIRAEELKAFLANHDLTDTIKNGSGKSRPHIEATYQAPVMGWSEASEEIRRWKARGLKVGFTNGCFDILHYGHVTYLNDARRRCDRLIVGLNRDASIRLLKGENRPVHSEEARARVISALGAVDMVILFGAQEEGQDNTPCELLSQLQPDIFFKGGDYTIDQLPEAPIIMRNGGKVEIMPIYEGHSTTESIKKIKA